MGPKFFSIGRRVWLGFQGDVATWGTMLHDASNVALLGDAPWTLATAVPIFMVTLGVNIAARSGIVGQGSGIRT